MRIGALGQGKLALRQAVREELALGVTVKVLTRLGRRNMACAHRSIVSLGRGSWCIKPAYLAYLILNSVADKAAKVVCATSDPHVLSDTSIAIKSADRRTS